MTKFGVVAIDRHVVRALVPGGATIGDGIGSIASAQLVGNMGLERHGDGDVDEDVGEAGDRELAGGRYRQAPALATEPTASRCSSKR